MNNDISTIFSESDLIICDVPVPQGYPQSQTHTGVAVRNNYVYLCSSPFPQIKRSKLKLHVRALLWRLTNGCYPPKDGECNENPMLYWGIITDKAPVKFQPFIGNPIINQPPSIFGYPSYNSDPDVFIEDECLYLINRECIRKTPPGSKHFQGDCLIRLDMIKFKLIDNIPQYVSYTSLLETDDNVLSPCITKMGNEYLLLYLDTYSYLSANSKCHLYIRRDEKIEGSYSNRSEIMIDSEDYIPWHLSVFKYNSRLYSIIACVKKDEPYRLYQMLGVFNTNLTRLRIYQKPLISIPSYRGAAYVDEEGIFTLYSTTDRYKVIGSKSVDYKDIVVSSMDFERVLDLLTLDTNK